MAEFQFRSSVNLAEAKNEAVTILANAPKNPQDFNAMQDGLRYRQVMLIKELFGDNCRVGTTGSPTPFVMSSQKVRANGVWYLDGYRIELSNLESVETLPNVSGWQAETWYDIYVELKFETVTYLSDPSIAMKDPVTQKLIETSSRKIFDKKLRAVLESGTYTPTSGYVGYKIGKASKITDPSLAILLEDAEETYVILRTYAEMNEDVFLADEIKSEIDNSILKPTFEYTAPSAPNTPGYFTANFPSVASQSNPDGYGLLKKSDYTAIFNAIHQSGVRAWPKNVVYVSPSFTENIDGYYESINAAITACLGGAVEVYTDGVLILVYPGVYAGDVTHAGHFSIVALDPDSTYLVGQLRITIDSSTGTNASFACTTSINIVSGLPNKNAVILTATTNPANAIKFYFKNGTISNAATGAYYTVDMDLSGITLANKMVKIYFENLDIQRSNANTSVASFITGAECFLEFSNCVFENILSTPSTDSSYVIRLDTSLHSSIPISFKNCIFRSNTTGANSKSMYHITTGESSVKLYDCFGSKANHTNILDAFSNTYFRVNQYV